MDFIFGSKLILRSVHQNKHNFLIRSLFLTYNHSNCSEKQTHIICLPKNQGRAAALPCPTESFAPAAVGGARWTPGQREADFQTARGGLSCNAPVNWLASRLLLPMGKAWAPGGAHRQYTATHAVGLELAPGTFGIRATVGHRANMWEAWAPGGGG
jgi:hypothetical protein